VLGDNHELFLIKRRNEPKPGTWALPSGYVEIDETSAECAVHELEEETGLIGEAEEFLGYFFSEFVNLSARYYFWISYEDNRRKSETGR